MTLPDTTRAGAAFRQFLVCQRALYNAPGRDTATVAIDAADAFNRAYAPEAAERLTELYRERVEDFLERRCVACPS